MLVNALFIVVQARRSPDQRIAQKEEACYNLSLG